MSVVVSVEETGPCRREVVIEVPAPAVEAEHQRVLQEFSRQVQLPGFRKGKVPRGVVERRFKAEIESELLDRLLPRYWHQAEAEKSLEPLLPPQVDEVQITLGEPLTFKAIIEVSPQITLTELDALVLPNPPVTASDEEIQETLDDLRRRHGDWVPVERAAGQGDLVTLEIRQRTEDDDTGDKDSEGAEEEPPAQILSIEVGDARVWEELSVAVTGLAAGQRSQFSRAVGEGDEAETRTYDVRAQVVKEKELSELDDEFAETVGGFETLEELRQAIATQIGQSKETQRLRQREVSLLDQLRDNHPIELPQRVVEKEMEELLSRQAEQMASQGLDLDKAQLDWPALLEQSRPVAEKRVHARLVLDAIVKDRGIEASEEEFEGALTEIARGQKTSTQQLRQTLDRNGQLANLKAQLNRDKAVKGLLGIGAEAAEKDNP